MASNYIKIFMDGENRIHQKALAWLQSQHDHIVEIDLMKEPITPRRLEELAAELNCTARDMVNEQSEKFQKDYANADLSEHDWLTVLAHNHDMIRMPIVVKDNKAVFLDSPGDVVSLEDLFN
ncbi:MAG: hypothetical protein N2167_03335 [Flavobacteriales bacterium]|nr:hypothetical protein [Flavobacteriales bacterium]